MNALTPTSGQLALADAIAHGCPRTGDAVSYTHLDVYKRQVLAGACNALGERRVFLNDGKSVVFR